MPHSTTKKHRPKRPDIRPNGKRRNKERLASVDKMEAKDLITTRTPRSERKERAVTGELRKPRKSTDDVRIRSLHKLLRQIQQLGERESAGDELNAPQLKKLARMDSVIAELEEVLGVEDEDSGDDEKMSGSGETGDEEDEINDDDEGDNDDDDEKEDKTTVKTKRTAQSMDNPKTKKIKTDKDDEDDDDDEGSLKRKRPVQSKYKRKKNNRRIGRR